ATQPSPHHHTSHVTHQTPACRRFPENPAEVADENLHLAGHSAGHCLLVRRKADPAAHQLAGGEPRSQRRGRATASHGFPDYLRSSGGASAFFVAAVAVSTPVPSIAAVLARSSLPIPPTARPLQQQSRMTT